MFSSLPTTLLLALLATQWQAYAQSLSNLGLSQTCSSALAASVANPNLANCLNIVGAIQIVETTPNASIIEPVNSWVTTVCTAEPCNNATLSEAAKNITQGCATDLAQFGITDTAASTVADQIVQLYPTLRQLLCLKDTNVTSKPFCLTEVLTDLQAALGEPLSINNLEQLPASIIGQGGLDIPSNLTCSTCTQATWNIVKPDLATFINTTTVDDALAQQCGAAFVQSTSLPSNIVEATGTAAAAGSGITSTPSTALRVRSSISGLILIGAVVFGLLL